MSDDTQEDAGDNNKEEVSIISGTSSSNDDEYPKVSFMIRLPSVKIITVTFSLSQKIDEIKSEIQSQFGLDPSQYILNAGYKVVANDRCSLLDYNIQPNQTLDIVPRANYCLLGGAEDDNSQDGIDERLKQTVSKLKKTHGLQLQGRSNEELAWLLREISVVDRLLVMKAFKVPYSQGGKRLTRDELINSFLRQKDAGFPLLRRSLMTKAERETERRASETSDERQARQENNAKQMGRTRASETSDERQARQAKVAKRNAQTRASETPPQVAKSLSNLQHRYFIPPKLVT